jgi:hypothetical protein
MNFLHKLEPHLISKDIQVQKFVLRILDDIHPFIPAEWTDKLLKDAIESEAKEFNILASVDKYPLQESSFKLLIQGIEKADKSRLHYYRSLLDRIEPELALKHQQELQPYIEKNNWDFYRFLQEGTEEEIWEEYGSVLAKLDTESNFNYNLYTKAKHLAKTLMKEGWIDEREIELILQEQLNERYFGFTGILAIYLICLMNLPKFIPMLVSLLDRDEDILLEEVADTLIAFQSDEVVEMVLPYARKLESSIFAISVLSGTKTAKATQVLKDLFKVVEYEDEQSLVFEALCHQLSIDALPEIEEYMDSEPESYLIEIEETAYGFYKVMGVDHHDLPLWKQIAEEKDREFETNMENDQTVSIGEPFRTDQKVGRNDPCPCGSGKKYKKCCA